MEQLQNHLTECVFSPNSEMICDKGCNIKITRGEYEGENCFTHLGNRQQKQQEHFDKITSRQEKEITKLNKEVGRQRVEITKLNVEGSMHRDEVTKLSEELNGVHGQITNPGNVKERQQEKYTELSDEVDTQRDQTSKLSDELGRQREDLIRRHEEQITKFIEEIGRQRGRISKLNDVLSSIRGRVKHCENVINQQVNESIKLTDEVSRIHLESESQREEFTKLSNKVVGMHREDILKLSDEPGRQREDLTKLVDEDKIQREKNLKVMDVTTPKWQIFNNMKTSIDQPLILEHGGKRDSVPFAQLLYSLEPTTPVFKIKVLDTNVDTFIIIGLTPKGHLTNSPELTYKSIGYCNKGFFYVNGGCRCVGEKWENDDIIECRINFPNNFINDGQTNVEVNFTRNGQSMFSKDMEMPIDGFFPTVDMWSGSDRLPKIEFLNFP